MMCHPQCTTPLDQKVTSFFTEKKKKKKTHIYFFKLWANHSTLNLDANNLVATNESVTSGLGKAVLAPGVMPSQQ